MPAARSRRASSSRRVLPFLTTASPERTECAAMAPTASSTGTGPNFTPRRLRSRRRVATISPRIDERDLGRRDRPDVEPDRRMDAGEVRLAEAARGQPLDPALVRLPRPEGADIEALRLQRRLERRVVDLRVVGERQERGVAVEAEARQGRVGPFRQDRHVGKALRRREGGARVDDRDVEVERRAPSGARAWLIWTAPTAITRTGGTCTVRKSDVPSASTSAAAAEAQALERAPPQAGRPRPPPR